MKICEVMIVVALNKTLKTIIGLKNGLCIYILGKHYEEKKT